MFFYDVEFSRPQHIHIRQSEGVGEIVKTSRTLARSAAADLTYYKLFELGVILAVQISGSPAELVEVLFKLLLEVSGQNPVVKKPIEFGHLYQSKHIKSFQKQHSVDFVFGDQLFPGQKLRVNLVKHILFAFFI